MLELVFAPADEWIGRSEDDIIQATMVVSSCASADLLLYGPQCAQVLLIAVTAGILVLRPVFELVSCASNLSSSIAALSLMRLGMPNLVANQ